VGAVGNVLGTSFNRQIEAQHANLSDHELAVINFNLFKNRFDNSWVGHYSSISDQRKDIATLTRLILILSSPDRFRTGPSLSAETKRNHKVALSNVKELLATIKTAIPMQQGDPRLRAMKNHAARIELNRAALFSIEKQMLERSRVVFKVDAVPRLEPKNGNAKVTEVQFARYQEAVKIAHLLSHEVSRLPTGPNKFWAEKASRIVDLLTRQMYDGLPKDNP
jgi:hypothetical protein